MAGLPPETIHVKRKRGTDEGPVDFLRLERSKRYRSLSGDGAWVYQRKKPDAEREPHPTEPSDASIPTIKPTQEGDEDRLLRRPHKPAHHAPVPRDVAVPGPAPAAPGPPPAPTVLSHPITDRTRRFHLSRPNSPQPPAGVSKKRLAPAVFIERGVKKQREAFKAIIEERNVTPAESPRPSGESSPAAQPSGQGGDEEPAAARQPSPVRYKRPGTRARTAAPDSKPALPPSMRDREHTNMEELASAMDSWTLAEIAKNLERMEAQGATSKYSPARTRFKPRAPKQRYFERHPEALAEKEPARARQPAAGRTVMNVDVGDSTDDEDYVLETYERVPAERLRDQAVPADRVGLLVFDTEPDMAEFFYGNESDSEEEFPEDEEDENAENYYTTEYPDEDLEWDDEFDRNAYHYVNQNASDLEEFDERDFIDEVWERTDNAGGLHG